MRTKRSYETSRPDPPKILQPDFEGEHRSVNVTWRVEQGNQSPIQAISEGMRFFPRNVLAWDLEIMGRDAEEETEEDGPTKYHPP